MTYLTATLRTIESAARAAGDTDTMGTVAAIRYELRFGGPTTTIRATVATLADRFA